MKCLLLQTSQGVVFSEAGRYYTLTPGRAVRKRRASACEGRSDSDRAERLDARRARFPVRGGARRLES